MPLTATKYPRETGTRVPLHLLPPGAALPGGGMTGLTADLDATVVSGADLLAGLYPDGQVTIRFNSNRKSGGAFLVTNGPDGVRRDCGVGISASLNRDPNGPTRITVYLDADCLNPGAADELTAAGHRLNTVGVRTGYFYVSVGTHEQAVALIRDHALPTAAAVGASQAAAHTAYRATRLFYAYSGPTTDRRVIVLPGTHDGAIEALTTWTKTPQGRRSGNWAVYGYDAAASIPGAPAGGFEPGRVYKQLADGTFTPTRVHADL